MEKPAQTACFGCFTTNPRLGHWSRGARLFEKTKIFFEAYRAVLQNLPTGTQSEDLQAPPGPPPSAPFLNY
jgi:hypothetical protein